MSIAVRILALAALTIPAFGASGQMLVEDVFGQGGAVHFRRDHLTGATYLRLATEGTYEVIAVEHMGRMRLDAGRWRADGSELVLESDQRVRDVTSPALRIFLRSQREVALLPELRSRILTLHARLDGRPVYPADVASLRVVQGKGEQRIGVKVDLDVAVEYGVGHAAATSLLKLAKAIDSYLADPGAQRVFPYRSHAYRGHTFLVPLAPGIEVLEPTPATVRKDIDEYGGRAPPYIFLLLAESEYNQDVGRNYPFRFFPEMNPTD